MVPMTDPGTVPAGVMVSVSASPVDRQPNLGESEVEDLDPAVGGDDHVFRLQVAVNDPLGSGPQPTRRRSPLRSPPPSANPCRWTECPAEVLTLQQFGDRVGDALFGPEIMDGENVRVVQFGDSLRLALETGETIRI